MITDEEIEQLAYNRRIATADHRVAKAELAGWKAAVEWLRKQSGDAFVALDDSLAIELRKLAARMALEGTSRHEPRIEETLRAAAEAERVHIAAVEAQEKAK